MDKIFYKAVYHHIIYLCDFLVNLNDFFIVIYTSFYEIVKLVPYKKRPETDGYSSKPAHHAKSVPASRTGEFQKLFVFVAAAGLSSLADSRRHRIAPPVTECLSALPPCPGKQPAVFVPAYSDIFCLV